MNIFYCDASPYTAAEALDNKRVIKMILESAQLLSNSMHYRGLKGPLKETHRNHPCSIAVRENYNNYMWVLNHFYWLLRTYETEYNKEHTYYSLFTIFNDNSPRYVKTTKNMPNCTTYKEETNIITAYRKYLIDKWNNDKLRPKWGKRGKPYWYKTKLDLLLYA